MSLTSFYFVRLPHSGLTSVELDSSEVTKVRSTATFGKSSDATHLICRAVIISTDV